jgi:hypothetical protein
VTDFTAGSVHDMLSFSSAKLIVFQLLSGLLIDPDFVVLHLAVFTDQKDIGSFSAWHR